MKYLVIIEKTSTGYSAYTPDLPGCIATGATRKELQQNMREVVQFHLEGLRIERQSIPPSTTHSSYITLG